MAKIYLAAQYSRRNEMKQYRYILHAHNFKVTSRWLDETSSITGNMGDESDSFYAVSAADDLDDIDASSIFVLFSESPLVGIPRGGRNVEYGYALKAGKKLFVVGPKENIFHYVGNATHFENFWDLKDYIVDLYRWEQ